MRSDPFGKLPQNIWYLFRLPVTRSLGTFAPVSRAPEAGCDNVSSKTDADNVCGNMVGCGAHWRTSALPDDQLTTEISETRDYTRHCWPGPHTHAGLSPAPSVLVTIVRTQRQSMSGQYHQDSKYVWTSCVWFNAHIYVMHQVDREPMILWVWKQFLWIIHRGGSAAHQPLASPSTMWPHQGAWLPTP